VRKRTPIVFVLLVIILLFRIIRILTAPAEATTGEKEMKFFQLLTVVIPLAGLLVLFLLSYKKLEVIKFTASFTILST
jgi:hypothetical protein